MRDRKKGAGKGKETDRFGGEKETRTGKAGRAPQRPFTLTQATCHHGWRAGVSITENRREQVKGSVSSDSPPPDRRVYVHTYLHTRGCFLV